MVNECIEELRARDVLNIMGNHDGYLLNNTGCPRSNSANICLDYQRRIITQENLSWIAKSVVKHECGPVSMVHGGWNDYTDEYLHDVDEAYFEGMSGRVFASGHTHVQMMRSFNGKEYFNPGSVGQPRDRDCRAAFAILVGDVVTMMRVEYDIDWIAREMGRSSFSDHYYKNLYQGVTIGHGQK
jgi:predicted phosphodiesterase